MRYVSRTVITVRRKTATVVVHRRDEEDWGAEYRIRVSVTPAGKATPRDVTFSWAVRLEDVEHGIQLIATRFIAGRSLRMPW